MRKNSVGYEPTPHSPLMPHAFSTKIYFTGASPSISILPEALRSMQALINSCDTEISWMGTVKRINFGHFQIQNIYLLKQKVSSVDTEISVDGFSSLVQELLKERNGIDVVNSIKFWGHSHVEMDVGQSSTDDDQLMEFAKDNQEYFIRGIGNKMGKMSFTIIFPKLGIAMEEVPWSITYPEMELNLEYWKKEIKEKVRYRRGCSNYAGYRSFDRFQVSQPGEDDWGRAGSLTTFPGD